MTHLSDEDLLAFHWDGDRRAGRHVAACADCASALESLRSLLRAVENAPVPDRGEAYGREIWAQIAPRLSENPRRFALARLSWPSARALRLGTAAALLVGAAFLAGRLAATRGQNAVPSLAAQRAASERVLFVDLGRHLDRSEAVLLELVHAPGGGAQDVSAEQARLSDLLPASRLYRQTARRAGDPALSSLLDDIERVLLDVQHGPARLSPAEADALRARIESEGILFRLRILSSRVREREERNSGGSPSPNFSIERKRA